MQLTLTFMSSNDAAKECVMEQIDVMVNSQQKIIDTIKILQEVGKFPGMGKKTIKIRSVRKKYMIQPEQTYEQAKIFYGDILEIL